MGRSIILNESCMKGVYRSILQEALSPSLEQVRVVKDYLDKNFARQNVDDITPDGYPTTTPMFVMLSSKGVGVKTMTPREMLLLLDDKFPNIIKDDNDRRKFLKFVAQSWYYLLIGKNGQLQTNLIL